MVIKSLLFALIFFWTPASHAGDLEGFFGAGYTTFDNIGTSYNQYGVSARVKYNSFNSGHGLTSLILFNGNNIMLGDYMVGYGIKTKGKLFLEASISGAYSAIWGTGIAVLGSIGYSFGNNVYFNLPLILRNPGFLGLAPMFGYRF